MRLITLLPLLLPAIVSADARSVFKQCQGAIVKVETTESVGTGFAIGDGSLIVTCRHVIADDYRNIRISGPVSCAGTVVMDDPETDLCLIRLPVKVRTRLQINAGASPQPGTKVYLIGNALGFLDKTIAEGIVSGVRKTPTVALIQNSAPISKGCSGGPLLNDQGVVVGVAQSFISRGQQLNFAVSAYDLCRLKDAFAASHGQPAARQIVLGRLAQITEATNIFSRPDAGSHVYYQAKAYEYIVINPYKTQDWYRVLLQNKTYGYVSADKVAELPYQVTMPRNSKAFTEDPTPTLPKFEPPTTELPDVARTALIMVGLPYSKDGTNIFLGVDEATFVYAAYASCGISLPKNPNASSKVGIKISRLEELKAGDRLYFWDKAKGKIASAGIYLGNGYMVFCSKPKGVQAEFLGQKKWLDRLVDARRDK